MSDTIEGDVHASRDDDVVEATGDVQDAVDDLAAIARAIPPRAVDTGEHRGRALPRVGRGITFQIEIVALRNVEHET